MITQEQLAEIKDYCAKATAGPWRQGTNDIDCVFVHHRFEHTPDGERVLLKMNHHYPYELDMRFIAQARTDLPLLVAEVERSNCTIKENDTNWATFIADFARQAQVQVEPTDLIGAVLRMLSDKALSADLLRSDLSVAQKRIEELEAELADYKHHEATRNDCPQ